MSVFISYSSKDAELANSILNALEGEGVSCFIAPRDIRTGRVYAEEIVLALDSADVVVLVLTENSNNSQHVLREIERAVSHNMPIISYREEEMKLIPAMEYFLMSTQWLDDSHDGTHKELIESVRDLIESKWNSSDGDEEGGKKGVTLSSFESVSHNGYVLKKKKATWKLIALIMIAVWIVTMIIFMVDMYHTRQLEEKMLAEASQNANDTQLNSTLDEQETKKDPSEYQVGEEVIFGKYLGDDIEWQIVSIDDGIATMITSQVICMKGFEGAESGKVLYTISGETTSQERTFTPVESMEALGSNDWEKSSLRAWLNSSKNYVEYIGMIPNASTMCDHDNAYNSKPGFLKEFTESEIEALVLTALSTEYHNPADGSVTNKSTEDYVYVPTVEELDQIKAADVAIFCLPTEAALEEDESVFYNSLRMNYGTEYICWWLRTPAKDSYSELVCVFVGRDSEETCNYAAAVGGMGVRPMLRVDLSKL